MSSTEKHLREVWEQAIDAAEKAANVTINLPPSPPDPGAGTQTVVPPPSIAPPSVITTTPPVIAKRGGPSRPFLLAMLVIVILIIIGAVIINNYKKEVQREREARVVAENLRRQDELRRQEAEQKAEQERKAREEAEARRKQEQEEAEKASLSQKQALQRTQVEVLKRQYSGEYFQISIKNECDEKISVALNYKALNDKWVTEGWWVVEPNRKLDTGVVTRNGIFYYFVESPSHSWYGDDKDAIKKPILNVAFMNINGDPLEGPDRREVSFKRDDITGTYREYTIAFTCP